jgi:UDP-GlcNAc:undecaprenyl-phosphate GlcNAc-1-phosphate transferase
VSVAGLVCLLVALIATLSVTELVRVFAHRVRAVDSPGGRRVHSRPTARLGGLGIYWGFYLALALVSWAQPEGAGAVIHRDLGIVGMMIGSSMLLIVGVMDDVYGLKAPLKLLFQTLAALVLFQFGWRVETIGIPGVGAVAAGPWSLPLTLMWTLAVTNAFNLIDGLDGLAGGLTLIAAVALLLLMPDASGPVAFATAALAGALLGFLWFNLNPALIFMGDAGSLFVGFVVASLALRIGQQASPTAFPLIPLLLVAVPLYDTFDAIRRRAWAAARATRSPIEFAREARRRVMAPDGLHVHHRLVRFGLSTRGAVARLWLAAAVFAGAGLVLAQAPVAGAVFAVIACVLTSRGLAMMRSLMAAAPPEPAAATRLELAAADGVAVAAAGEGIGDDAERRAA